MRTRSSLLIAGIAAAASLLAGCALDGGDTSQPSASGPPVSGNHVSVVDNDFEPGNLEVAAGDTVTWTWEGRTPHNVVGDDFDSGIQDEGTFTHTFAEPGTYDYECSLHRGMNGRITVAAEDLVGAAVYLGSDASTYVTGQTIFIEGGLLLT